MLPDVNEQAASGSCYCKPWLLFCHSFSPMLDHILKNGEQEQASPHLGYSTRLSVTERRKAANKRQVSGPTLLLGCIPSDLSLSLVLNASQYCYVGHYAFNVIIQHMTTPSFHGPELRFG